MIKFIAFNRSRSGQSKAKEKKAKPSQEEVPSFEEHLKGDRK